VKIAICGDTHIGAVFGLGRADGKGGNTRVNDYKDTLNYIVDYCIESKIDIFVQTGDVFENRNPIREHISIVDDALKRLSNAGIASVVMMGNHDYRRNKNTFSSAISSLAAKDYPNVKIYIKPEVLTYSKGIEDGVNLLLLPYRDRRMYDGESTEEDSHLYENEAEKLLKNCENDFPIVTIGHNFFKEGTYDDYKGSEVLMRPGRLDKCDLVVMGHYHDFKILRKRKPAAIYVGAMEKKDFGDIDSDKYFLTFDSSNKQIKFIKNPCRPLREIDLDLSLYDEENIWKVINDNLNSIDLNEAIVRYRVVIKDSFLPYIKKGDLYKKLYERGAFFVAKVVIDALYENVTKDDSILNEKNDFMIIGAYIRQQNYHKIEEDKMLKIISDLLEEK